MRKLSSHIEIQAAPVLSKKRRTNQGATQTIAISNLAMQDIRRGAGTTYRVSNQWDSHEQEARHTANRVMAMASANKVKPAPGTNTSAEGATPKNSAAIMSNEGQPLPLAVKEFFEPRFGSDLSQVRIHNDFTAQQTAKKLNARAFTQNNHIGFDSYQYDPHSTEGKHLLAHELAHVTQETDPNTVYCESWHVDDGKREVERELLVQLNFNNTWEDLWAGTGWTPARKNTFRSGFVNSIESTFNSGGFVLKPPASASDVLPPQNIDQGYKPLVDIQLVPEDEWSFAEDWEVDVSSNPKGEFRTSSSNRSYGTMDEADITAVAKEGGAPGTTQIPAVHEFGHFIGLQHPGAGLEGGWFRPSRLSPGATEYSHTGTDVHGRTVHGPTDLMGSGMGMRPFYYDAWARALEEHIDQLRSEQRWRAMMRALFPEPEKGDFPVPTGDTRLA